MMQVHEENQHGSYIIRSYEAGNHICINDKNYTEPLVLCATQLISPWQPHNLEELKVEHWQSVIELKPEIVLIGTGPSCQILPAALLTPLYQHNIGVECMDTGAACRTYTALISEDRAIAAALFIQS